MNMQTARALLLSGVALTLSPTPALAEDQTATSPAVPAEQTTAEPDRPAAADGAGADIVVTARRTNESLQRVPVAVTALSSDTLARNNINDAYGALAKVPAVQAFTRNVGNAGALGLVRIRGVAPPAAYFNDVPMPGLEWSLFAPFFDISSVQALKGPQGTLFGQASNAGAIIITPRKPGETFGGYVKASVGNFNLKTVEGGLDIPIIKDALFLRVSGVAYDRDGYIRDSITDRQVDGFARYEVGRAILLFKPSSDFSNETMFQMERVHDLTAGASGTPGDYDFFDNALNQRLAALNGMTFAQLNAARDQIIANQIKIGPYRTQGWSVGCPASALAPATSSTVPGPNLATAAQQPCSPGGGWIHSNALTNIVTWNFADSLTVKNIIGHWWGRQKYFGLYDNDGTRLIGNDQNPRNLSYTQPTNRVWSDELQASGKLGRLTYVAGAFFFDDKLLQDNPSFAPFTTTLALGATRTNTEFRSYAGYGQGTFDLTDDLKITAGIRHTWDTAFRRQIVLNPLTLAVTGSNGGPGTPTGEAHWQTTSYTLSSQYQITPDTMVYVTNSKGASSGGLQNNPAVPRFDPDFLNNLELGFKTTVRAGNVTSRVNVAGYYGWYDNAKVTTALVLPVSPGSSATAIVVSTFNAAAAKIKGFEIETNTSVGRIFSLSAALAYQDPHYTDFPRVNPLTNVTVNLRDQPIPLSPKWKVLISPMLSIPTDTARVGDVSVGADFTWRSQYWQNPVKPIIPDDPANPDTGLLCIVPRTAAYGYGPLSADGRKAYKTCAPSFYNINMHVDWDNVLGHQGLKLRLTITNVTANSKPIAINSQYDTLNAVGWQANDPRMVYGTISYDF